jgi:hypothetical protein
MAVGGINSYDRHYRQGEVNWIIETKGRVWEDTAIKDTAMRDWCARISPQTGQRWEYARVNQSTYEAQKPCTLVDATQMSSQESGEHDILVQRQTTSLGIIGRRLSRPLPAGECGG